MAQTILLVDDSKDILALVNNYLSQEGFRVVTAENGRDGIFCGP